MYHFELFLNSELQDVVSKTTEARTAVPGNARCSDKSSFPSCHVSCKVFSLHPPQGSGGGIPILFCAIDGSQFWKREPRL